MPSHLPFSSNAPYLTQLTTKLPYISYFEANILRIFSKEINCQSEYAPPHQVPTIFKSLFCCYYYNCLLLNACWVPFGFRGDEEMKMERLDLNC